MNFIELQSKLIALTKRNISQSEIAKSLGINRATVNIRAKQNSQISDKEITKIKNYFDLTSLDFEKGSKSENFIDITVRGDVSASMSYGVSVYDESKTRTYRISSKLAKDLDIKQNSTEMILASGDSMLPTIEGGDSLLIDLNKTEIYDGRIYCVRIDGQLYAKRLQKIPPCKIIVISDNQKYQSFEIDLSKKIDFDFAVIGEVRWWSRIAR